MKIKTFDIIKSNNTLSFTENYFNPLTKNGHKYSVLYTRTDGTSVVKEEALPRDHWTVTAIKVASYFTLILPLVALAVKWITHRQLPPIEVADPSIVKLFDLTEKKPADLSNFDVDRQVIKRAYSIGDQGLLEALRMKGNRNNPIACSLLATLYTEQICDKAQVAYWLKKSDELNYPFGTYWNAIINIDPVKPLSSFDKALPNIKQAASKGFTQAQEDLDRYLIPGEEPSSFIKQLYCWIKKGNPTIKTTNLSVFNKTAMIEELNKNPDLIPQLIKEANNQNPRAAYFLGCIYCEGLGVKKNMKTGFHWLSIACKANYAPALNWYAIQLLDHSDDPEIRKEAYQMIRSAAKRGNAYAMERWGERLINKAKTPEQVEKGAGYLKLAAQLLDTSHYSSAAAIVYRKIGQVYAYDKSPIVDPKLAFKSYHRAAILGDPPAQYALAKMYEEGSLVPQSITTAMLWYIEAANGGSSRAMLELGSLLRFGDNGVPENYNEAFYWLNKAAKKGQIHAYTLMAEMYQEGLGTPQDLKTAFSYFSHAGKKGDAHAQHRLAEWYYCVPDGQQINEEMLMKWVNQAIDQKHPDAFVLKARYISKHKEITESNLKEARGLLVQAAKLGQVDALFFVGEGILIGEGYKDFSFVPNDGIEMLRQSAKLGKAKASMLLGHIFSHNVKYASMESTKDFVIALSHYKKAMKSGHISAPYYLAKTRLEYALETDDQAVAETMFQHVLKMKKDQQLAGLKPKEEIEIKALILANKEKTGTTITQTEDSNIYGT